MEQNKKSSNWDDIYESDQVVVDSFYRNNNLPNEDMTLLKMEYKRLQVKYIVYLEQNKDVTELGQQMANVGTALSLYEIQKNGGMYVS
tara:strand:+ start:3921 stop:4184 length:264 start_codon:yes stop_codon:yes gene_type:complete